VKAKLKQAIEWARAAKAGDALQLHGDDFNFGYTDHELAVLQQVLVSRGLTLAGDDNGITAQPLRKAAP